MSLPAGGGRGGAIRARAAALDWPFIRRALTHALLITLFAISATATLPYYFVNHPEHLWNDVHVYFRATAAWVAGGNPWTTTWLDIPFAAPPPALLLNLPLLPLGESGAVIFWIGASALSVVVLLRRFRLPIYWLLFQPITEAFLGGSPDLVLAALLVVGVGVPAAVAKPYSVPALLAERRWRAIAVAGAIGVASLPILPWGQFLASSAEVAATIRTWGRPISAFGDPAWTALAVVALVSLGWRRGWSLATPALLAIQPHYLLYSMGTISRSVLLAAILTFAFPHAAALGVIAYAVVDRARLLLRRGQVLPCAVPEAAA